MRITAGLFIAVIWGATYLVGWRLDVRGIALARVGSATLPASPGRPATSIGLTGRLLNPAVRERVVRLHAR